MGIFKNGNRIKSATIIKALDESIASSNGLAEFIGCVVVLAVGALLGTEIKLPEKDSSDAGKVDEIPSEE